MLAWSRVLTDKRIAVQLVRFSAFYRNSRLSISSTRRHWFLSWACL